MKKKGLAYEIKCLEDIIALKIKLGHDLSFEQTLLKSYKNYTEDDYQDGLARRETSISSGITPLIGKQKRPRRF